MTMPAARAGRTVVGIGEVLWDLLPDSRQLGGAPINFACHAHALGAEAWTITRVGDDALGREIIAHLRTLGLRTEALTVDAGAPTGTVSVALAHDGQPTFTIHEQVAWDRLTLTAEAHTVVARADAVCFGSLGQRSDAARETIQTLVRAAPRDALRILDVNLRQQYYSHDLLDASLGLANVVKLNDHELPVLAALLGLSGDASQQLAELTRRYGLRMVALTRGAHGSLLYAEGRVSEHGGTPVRVVDSIGAGDAFTAALALGQLAGWDLDTINARANAVASFVCSQSGATPPLPQSLRQLFVSVGSEADV
jgi:fructokinase